MSFGKIMKFHTRVVAVQRVPLLRDVALALRRCPCAGRHLLCCCSGSYFLVVLRFRWHPRCRAGAQASPLCGAALTFFAAAKKVSKESGYTPPILVFAHGPSTSPVATATYPSRAVGGPWVLVKGIGVSGFLLPTFLCRGKEK
jgi:hypothetical protein